MAAPVIVIEDSNGGDGGASDDSWSLPSLDQDLDLDLSSDTDDGGARDDSWSLPPLNQDLEVAPSSDTDDGDNIFGTLDEETLRLLDGTNGETGRKMRFPQKEKMSRAVKLEPKGSPREGTSFSMQGMSDVTEETLLTGIGHEDYSLLQRVYVGPEAKGINKDDPLLPDFQRNGRECERSGISGNCLEETSVWLQPNELLVAVETKLRKDPPRLAQSGPLGPLTMLPSQWSTPLVPFVIGDLDSPVPQITDTLKKHYLVSARHKGQNVLTEKPIERKLLQKPTYTISAPKIHASSLMAMVISCELAEASCCRPKKQCILNHQLEDVVLDTGAIYNDIMDDIHEMNSWPYVQKFVNTESFSYTSQVFVRGRYSRQDAMLGKGLHEDITLIYPETIVPLECFVLSTAMKECFSKPTRGLVEVKEFSLVIKCYGPRPSKWSSYQLEPLYERMGLVCMCNGDETRPPCQCAQRYVDTLVRLSMDEGGSQTIPEPDTHPLASFHVAIFPKSMSAIAYNMFLLIDELTRGNEAKVKMDSTMSGNGVTLEVGSFQHQAAFISKSTKHSFCHQPSFFAKINLSSVLLKTARDVVNSVAQLCATVLFMMKHGSPQRTKEYDLKYNAIINEITDFFPQLTIKRIPATRHEKTKPLACIHCGRAQAFVKKGYTSILVCDNCKTDRLKERFSTKLAISQRKYRTKKRSKPYGRTGCMRKLSPECYIISDSE